MTATATVPETFCSERVLAAAVDAAFAETLAEELATALAEPEMPERTPIVLPETEALIAQASIATGPCPADPKTPSRSGLVATAGLRLTGRAAWWLVKSAAMVTALILVQTVRALWHLSTPATCEPPPPAPRASDFLAETSAEIHRSGWTQHRYQDERGVCVLGAQQQLLRRGVGNTATADRSCEHLLATVGRRTVPTWNDGLARREEQIHSALYRAAARARAADD